MPARQIENYDVACDLLWTLFFWVIWVYAWELFGTWRHVEPLKNFFHHWFMKFLAGWFIWDINVEKTKQSIADYNRTRRQPLHWLCRRFPGCEWVYDEVSNLFVSASWGWWMVTRIVGIILAIWCVQYFIVHVHPIRQYWQAELAQQRQDSLKKKRDQELKGVQSLDALKVMEASSEADKNKLVRQSIDNNIETLNREIETLDDEVEERFGSAIRQMQQPNTVVEALFGALATVVKSTVSSTISPLRAVFSRVRRRAKPTQFRRVVDTSKPVGGKVCIRSKSGKCKAKDTPQFTGQRRMCDDCHKPENKPVSRRACRARSPRS